MNREKIEAFFYLNYFFLEPERRFDMLVFVFSI